MLSKESQSRSFKFYLYKVKKQVKIKIVIVLGWGQEHDRKGKEGLSGISVIFCFLCADYEYVYLIRIH
jgi:hypothetical protein